VVWYMLTADFTNGMVHCVLINGPNHQDIPFLYRVNRRFHQLVAGTGEYSGTNKPSISPNTLSVPGEMGVPRCLYVVGALDR
jgi:hypothetical protein